MTGFKTPKGYLLTGLAGFGLTALLVYLAEMQISAPNPSTLVYRQSQVFFIAMLVFLVSAAFFLAGAWGAVRRRFSRKE